ncbi:hypothetical protein O6H91_Y257600 [Diphasiastrum complanatum]|nr:hypothetical protein O6H91_Y257600 [Diphasiastrum complanatum]
MKIPYEIHSHNTTTNPLNPMTDTLLLGRPWLKVSHDCKKDTLKIRTKIGKIIKVQMTTSSSLTRKSGVESDISSTNESEQNVFPQHRLEKCIFVGVIPTKPMLEQKCISFAFKKQKKSIVGQCSFLINLVYGQETFMYINCYEQFDNHILYTTYLEFLLIHKQLTLRASTSPSKISFFKWPIIP